MSFKKELKEFKKFKEAHPFVQKELVYKDEMIYYNDLIIKDKEGNVIAENDEFINVGYKLNGLPSKLLSNLFPYEFKFKGKKVNCIENVFQGLKFRNKKVQKLVFKYEGLDSNRIKLATDYDWKENGKLYWQGKEIDRFSQEYQDFLDELYISAIQNPLYRNVVKSSSKYIMHSMGVVEEKDTVFTRYEFEKMLNLLRDYLRSKE